MMLDALDLTRIMQKNSSKDGKLKMDHSESKKLFKDQRLSRFLLENLRALPKREHCYLMKI